MKHTKHKLLSSIATLFVCLAMFIGSTYAWFTDSASTGVNKIQAGNLDVEFYRGEVTPNQKITTDTKLFDKDVNSNQILWEPGVVSVEKLIVVNEGNLALKFKMGISNLVGGINYNYVIEAGQDTPTEKSLLDVLYVYTSSSDIDSSTARSLNVTNGIRLKDFISNNNFLSGELENNGNSAEVNIAIYWPQSSLDNEYNINNGRKVSSLESGAQTSLVVNFPVTLAATQLTSESDSFDNQYDASATYPFVLPESTITIVDTPATSFYSDYQATSAIIKNDNTELQEKVTVTANSATSINLDVEYTYGDEIVHKFSEVREKSYPLSKNLSDVTVTHSDSSVTMTRCSSKEYYDNEARDTAYYYDSQSGILYIKSSMYSTFTVTYTHDFVAVVDGEGYSDLGDALDSIKSSDEVVINIVNNIETPTTTYYFEDKEVVLNLNGYTISGGGYDGTFCVDNDATLIINGEGNVIGNDQNDYGMAIWACGENANVIINGGTYSNTLTHEDTQMDMIYASNGGKIVINGGVFNCITPTWTLNIRDADYRDGISTITVNGGKFYNYNPNEANNENPVANLLSEGKAAIKEGDWYRVVDVTTEDELKQMIASGNPTIDIYGDVNLTSNLSINKDVTIIGHDASIIGYPTYIGASNTVKFVNVEFAETTAKDKASSVYGEGFKGTAIFENCTFGNSNWESLQFTPKGDATIIIKDCNFKATKNMKRFIHVEPAYSNNYKLDVTITGSTFDGCEKVNYSSSDIVSVIDLDYIAKDSILTLGDCKFYNTDGSEATNAHAYFCKPYPTYSRTYDYDAMYSMLIGTTNSYVVE